MAAIKIDGVDVKAASGTKFHLAALRDWRKGPAQQWPSEIPPGAVEALLLSPRPVVSARPLTLVGWLEGDTVSALDDHFDELQFRLDPGINGTREIEVEIPNRTGLTFICRHLLTTPQTFDRGHLNQLVQPVTIELTCLKPYLYAAESSVASITATPKDIPIENAPVAGRLRIAGAFTNPVVTIKDHDANTVKTTSLTLTKSGGQWVELDCRPGALKPIVDNAGDSQLDALDLTSDFPWSILPEWRDGITPDEATMEVSSGTGEFFYRVARRY